VRHADDVISPRYKWTALSNTTLGSFMATLAWAWAASRRPTPRLHDHPAAESVDPVVAERVSNEPPVGSLFAAFLGYNPMQTLLGEDGLRGVPPQNAEEITGKTFFPNLISEPFIDGLRIAFSFSFILCLKAAWASWMRGAMPAHAEFEGDVSEALEEAVLA
jgi:hypothetical protein